MEALWAVFVSVFIAELGDKTQLATLMFSTNENISKWGVFLASSAALVLSSLIAVFLGSQFSSFINPQALKFAAGIGFIVIGLVTLLR